MECQSCGKQKADLTAKKSKLWPNTDILLCNDCIRGKFEPRAFIVLAGRTNGATFVLEYIKNHRYCGREITAAELIS